MGHLFQRLLASGACAAVLCVPRVAIAQPRSFIEGLSEFTVAVAGTYGDEGARIGPALDKMAGGLAAWDRDLAGFEAQCAMELRGAAPAVAVRVRTDLARRYAERGRFADALRELDAAISVDPLASPAYFLRGQLLETSSRDTEAGEAFRLAWVASTRDPIAAYHVLRHAATVDGQDVRGARDTLIAAHRRLVDGAALQKSAPFSSIDLVQQAMGDAPVVAPVIYRQGYARIARGEYGEAIAEFRRAAATDPLIVDPFSRSSSMTQAVMALRQGRTAEARSSLERFDGLRDSSEAQRVLGLVYWTDAQYDKSVEALTTAIQKNPRDERSRLALSRVLSSAGRGSDAERALHEMLQILPDSALAHAWLAAGYEDAGRVADARQEFEIAADSVTAGRGAFFASIARLAAAAGDYPGAIDALLHSIAARPNDAEIRKRLARALLQQDRADEAFRELIAALLIDPLDAGAHFGVGQIHLNAGRNEDAEAALRRAVQLSPGYTEARYALATALSRLGRGDEAAQEFDRVEQAQRLEIADRRLALTLATITEEAAVRTAEGNYDRAATLWRQAIEREPGRPSHHLDLAAVLTSAGRIDMAIEQYEIALRLGADPGAYRQLADLYSRAGRADDASRARASYTRALQGRVPNGGVAP